MENQIYCVYLHMAPRIFTTEIKTEVLKLYQEGISIKEISKRLGVYKDYPTKLAKEAGIARGSGTKNQMPLAKFMLGTKESDYWIGYIIADGNISKGYKKNSSVLSVATIDQEIVEKYLNYGEGNINIHKTPNITSLYFGNIQIIDYLQSIGITPKKSLTIELKFPLNFHILRGIFDGDGSVHNRKPTIKITTGSIKLATQISEFLIQEKVHNKIRKRNNSQCYDIWIERKADFKLFYDKLYEEASKEIYMERKKIKYEQTLKLQKLL